MSNVIPRYIFFFFVGFFATKITGCYLKSWDMLDFFVFLFLVCRFFFVCVWNFVFAFVIPYVDNDDFLSLPVIHYPCYRVRELPKCRICRCLHVG